MTTNGDSDRFTSWSPIPAAQRISDEEEMLFCLYLLSMQPSVWIDRRLVKILGVDDAYLIGYVVSLFVLPEEGFLKAGGYTIGRQRWLRKSTADMAKDLCLSEASLVKSLHRLLKKGFIACRAGRTNRTAPITRFHAGETVDICPCWSRPELRRLRRTLRGN